MKTLFDPEQAAFQLKTLHGLMSDVNADVAVNTWREACDRMWVLLDAMEPLVDGLYRYFTEGGPKT